MTNHPGRTPGSAQPLRMTPQQLTEICDRSGLQRQQLAKLAGVAVRTLQQYEAGDRAIPPSASGLLCLSLIVLGGPAVLLAPWVNPAVVEALAGRRMRRGTSADAAAPAHHRSRALGDAAAARVRSKPF